MATGRSVADILASKRIVKVVSQVGPGLTSLSRMFGMAIGGSNRGEFGGRKFFYDIFNNTRKVAHGSRPGSPTTRVAPQNVGEVMGTFPRAAETIPLLDEDIYNRRRIGGP